ncbi:hypothetical protein HDR66_01060 [bacterium]|nr:hypothetical protein [bacterium]
MAVAPMIIRKEKIRVCYLAIMATIAIGALAATKHFVFTYVYMVLPILMLLSIVLEKATNSRLYQGCTFFGKISLESYLFNGAIQIYIIWLMYHLRIPDYNNIVMYSLAIIIGTVLSFLINNLSKRIFDKIDIINNHKNLKLQK